ncbi:MAG: rhomboid family intramembrane serine protease [Gammaproteobacteria bacterium]
MLDLSLYGALIIFAVTIGASLIGLYSTPALIDRSLFRPYWFLRRRQYDTICASGFVHADLGHLIFNMVTFYFFAFDTERFLGTVKFLALYFIGLVVSHSCTYFKHKNNPNYASLGASGAISAVLFAYVVYFPTTTLIIFPLPIPIPASVFAVAYVAYSYWAGKRQVGHINHDAHLCGALFGIVFVAVTDPGAFARLVGMLG